MTPGASHAAALAGDLGPPTLDLVFQAATLDSRVTFTRAAGVCTDGKYTDATGSSYNSFGTNIPRITVASGLVLEEARTQLLLNTDAPVTQTTVSLGTGTYTLWVIGTGTATPSAGTVTATGFAATSAGTPTNFVVTGAGTVVVTVAGSLTRFQLELGTFPTSYIPRVAVAATRAADVAKITPISAWFNQTRGTLAVDTAWPSVPSYALAVNFLTTFGIAAGITTDVIGFWRWSSALTSGTVRVVGHDGVVPSSDLFAMSDLTKVRQAITWNGQYLAQATNGYSREVKAIALPAGVLAGMDTLWISSVNTGRMGQTIRRLRYWPRQMAPTELQSVAR